MTRKLSEAECFALLGNRQRLLIVQVLRDRCSPPLSVDEIVTTIAERTSEDHTPDVQREIRIAVYHNHIPRLEAAEVVSYDRDADTVATRPNLDTLIPFLEQLSEADIAVYDT